MRVNCVINTVNFKHLILIFFNEPFYFDILPNLQILLIFFPYVRSIRDTP